MACPSVWIWPCSEARRGRFAWGCRSFLIRTSPAPEELGRPFQGEDRHRRQERRRNIFILRWAAFSVGTRPAGAPLTHVGRLCWRCQRPARGRRRGCSLGGPTFSPHEQLRRDLAVELRPRGLSARADRGRRFTPIESPPAATSSHATKCIAAR
jgi:hypothetical protein